MDSNSGGLCWCTQLAICSILLIPYFVLKRDDGGEMLLANAEFYGQYLVTGLMSDSVETGDQDQIILNGTLNNIGETYISNACNQYS